MAQTQVRSGQILDASLTHADVASANIDGTAGTPSLRTLGTGALQALAGNTVVNSVAIGAAVTSGTAGSVLFVGTGPVLAQDNANLFWDDSNNRLGVGTASPAVALHVLGAGSANYGSYDTPLCVEGVSDSYIEIKGAGNQAGVLYNRDGSTGWFGGLNNAGYFRINSLASIDQAGVSGAKDGNTGLTIDPTGNVGIGMTAPGSPLHAILLNSTTAAVDSVATLGHKSSGTPAAGFGAALLAQLQSSTTENQSVGRLSWEWATATHASRKVRGILTAYDTAERECVRFEASGTAPMLGFLGAAAAVQQLSTADLKDTICIFGFQVNAGASPLNLDGGLLTCGSAAIALGTITTDAQALSTTATWNAAGVTFTHIKHNVTSTASAAGSLLLDLQVGGASQFNIGKAGTVTLIDAANLVVGTSTGTRIGTAITQKLGFYNVTPIAQRAGAAQAAVAATGATTTTPWGYTTAAQANAIVTLVNELRAWAVAQGFIKGAA